MKKLFIDFLVEEAKFTSLDNKKKQEELLNNTSVNLQQVVKKALYKLMCTIQKQVPNGNISMAQIREM